MVPHILGDVMIIQMAEHVLKEIEATVGSLPAEQCGWLGAVAGEYITHYFFDGVSVAVNVLPWDRLSRLWPPHICVVG